MTPISRGQSSSACFLEYSYLWYAGADLLSLNISLNAASFETSPEEASSGIFTHLQPLGGCYCIRSLI